jgi:hypothetical protein
MTPLTRPRARPDLHVQVGLGGGIGVACGTAVVALVAGPGPLMAFGAVLGMSTGVVAGVLLWLGSADLPEEPILDVPERDRVRRETPPPA